MNTFSSGRGRRELAETLDAYVEWLCESDEIRSATTELKEAIANRDRTKAASSAEALRQRANKIEQLLKLVDQVDPHVLDQAQVKTLYEQGPIKLVKDALHQGKFRERRMLLEAIEAQTNQYLAWAAFLAAITALAVPFIERGLKVH